jgi:hypothetical protein
LYKYDNGTEEPAWKEEQEAPAAARSRFYEQTQQQNGWQIQCMEIRIIAFSKKSYA